MLERRCGHVTDFSSSITGKTLVAAGGYGGGSDYWSSAEYCQMDSDESLLRGFRPLPSMTCKRTGASGGFGPGGAFYVFGGSTDGATPHATVEWLDLRCPAWETMPMPRSCAYGSGTFTRGGYFFLCGGYSMPPNGQPMAMSNAISCFDARTRRWVEDAGGNNTLSSKIVDSCAVILCV